MKLAIIGSNEGFTYQLVRNVITSLVHELDLDQIVTNGEEGVNTFAEQVAFEMKIPTEVFLPNHQAYKTQADLVRNSDIVGYCDKLVAFQYGNSVNTRHTIGLARRAEKLLYVVEKYG